MEQIRKGQSIAQPVPSSSLIVKAYVFYGQNCAEGPAQPIFKYKYLVQLYRYSATQQQAPGVLHGLLVNTRRHLHRVTCTCTFHRTNFTQTIIKFIEKYGVYNID